MTNEGYGGSDARLYAVNLENMLRGISDDSAEAGELHDSWAKSLRSKSNLQKQQIESNLQSQAAKSNLLGPESNHNVPQIAI